MSSRLNPDAEFAYGAGQLHPTKALSPGLIYDMDTISYLQFLCHEGLNGSSFASLIGTKISCSHFLPGLAGEDAINYPTMQLTLSSKKMGPTVGVFRRTVTNVGPTQSVYNATISAPAGVEITVKPMSLYFSRNLQKRSFMVVVKANPMSKVLVSGSIIWRSSRHTVRTPTVVINPQED